MKITTNNKARVLVQGKEEFKGSNISGKWVSETLYVVFSYGFWGMFAYSSDCGMWFENDESYILTEGKNKGKKSRTTPKQKFYTRPCENCMKIDNEEMNNLIKAS